MYENLLKNLFKKKVIDGTFLPLFYARDKEDWGIGDINGLKTAVDLHYLLNQNLIEILPLNYSSAFESPYSVLSSRLFNTIYLSPSKLLKKIPSRAAEIFIEEHRAEINRLRSSAKVLYNDVRNLKEKFFKIIYEEFIENANFSKEFNDFKKDNENWIYDHILYKIIREDMLYKNPSKGWDFRTWPEKIRTRDTSTLQSYKIKYKKELDLEVFLQWAFWAQWHEVQEYAASKNISFMGDIPFSVDGADIWISPDIFKLKAPDFKRKFTQGVPPDFFSPFGQYWQFYAYDWENEKATDFLMERFSWHQKLFSVVRLDHVLGYYRSFLFYEDPDRKLTLKNLGIWEKISDLIKKGHQKPYKQGDIGWKIYKILLNAVREQKEYLGGKAFNHFFSKKHKYIINSDQMLLIARESLNKQSNDPWITHFSVEKSIYENVPMFDFLRISKEKSFQDNDALCSYLFAHNEHAPKPDDSIRPCFFSPGPGEKLMKKFLKQAKKANTLLISEALGVVPEFVVKSLNNIMAINYIPLIYGMTPESPQNLYFPPNHDKYAFVTFALHDSETLNSWWKMKSEYDRQVILNYLYPRENENAKDHEKINHELHVKLLSKVYDSKAFIKVLLWTDIFLSNDDEGINKPGSQMGQWVSRMPIDADLGDLLNCAQGKSSTEKAEKAIRLLKDLKQYLPDKVARH